MAQFLDTLSCENPSIEADVGGPFYWLKLKLDFNIQHDEFNKLLHSSRILVRRDTSHATKSKQHLFMDECMAESTTLDGGNYGVYSCLWYIYKYSHFHWSYWYRYN